eukprot:TRINITY_DN1084_c1_g3_i1.p1 TRINITY_DN1084_c1_g3~~TRINITY_DN1084_c1_g3_i1.p1  ORF type:complete len:276 (+),score=72.05 TRINITY_DN1084_c1_g3_i1:42-869(+)
MMMQRLSFFIFILLLLNICICKNNILKLYEENYNEETQVGNWLFRYCAYDDISCKDTQKMWEEIKDYPKITNLMIGEIDCTTDPSLCLDKSIDTFPTYLLHEELGGSDYVYPKKLRDIENLWDWAEGVVIGYIEEIDDKNFAAIVNGDWVLMFYNIWCMHSRLLLPTMRRVAYAFSDNDDNINIGRVDCGKAPELCGYYKVERTPTLKYISYPNSREFIRDRNMDVYMKLWNEEAIKEFIIDSKYLLKNPNYAQDEENSKKKKKRRKKKRVNDEL